MTDDIGLLGRAFLRREANLARERAGKLRILHNIGTVIVSSADVDKVLMRVVEAAVFISNAEEGALLLLDEGTQELYLRAQKGLGEKYANGFRMRVDDSIAGEVIRSGLPQRLTSNTRDLKVATGYMVNSIVYVPVRGPNGPIGVLSVDNQVADTPISEDTEEFLIILAGYAAIAIENARRIEELEQRSDVVHGNGGNRVSAPVVGDDMDRVSIVLPQDHTHSLLQAPFSDRLLDVINPYLNAVAHIQHCIDELEDKPASHVRVVSITHDSPIVATVDGIRDAAAVICQTVLPQRRHLDELASRLLLAEKEAIAQRVGLEVLEIRAHLAEDTNGDGWSSADTVDRVTHLQQLQHDCECLGLELQRYKIDVACNLIDWIAPRLSCAEKIYYVVRLLPALDQVLSSPLQLSTMQQRKDVHPAEDDQTRLLDSSLKE